MTLTPETGIILIVDDIPSNLAVLSKALSRANYQVAVATDGETAIEQVNYKPPDLILLDVMMPEIDGFETCIRLKANPSTCDIPIIFMTALSEAVDKVKGLRLGAVDYITKPFQTEEVLARVDVHLKLYNLTRTLEQKVEERTSELSQTLKQLQQAQFQLVQNEKMSALGQLVAGIAHEINNPVNFIHGNLTYTQQYVSDLFECIKIYQSLVSCPPPELKNLEKEIDLEFIKSDLPSLVASMQSGTQRIQSIVKLLQDFSRQNESGLKAANINQGLDRTLTLLNYRCQDTRLLKDIQIIKEYGELPLINCYCGQLNQVFMNILSNAIDALEERQDFPDDRPTIRIKTEVLDPQWISIRIFNNGSDIPESIKNRLFDPFFTTKPIGKGTGMGLSISYQIITRQHRGKLWCVSHPGQGAEFIIQLPHLSPYPTVKTIE
ncbi:MAG: response regulator [Geitlerinemataceae cyanobacterium]